MRKKNWASVVLSVFLGILLLGSVANSGTGQDLPRTQPGKPWRVAYVESGEFVNYASTLYALANGFAELGWLNTQGLPYAKGQKESREMWHWLARNGSENIEFVADAYYSLEQMGPEARTEVAGKLIQRLNEQQDIDLVLVMGTQAGQLLANDQHTVPMMVFSSSNALQAGIVQSVNDSGRDHVWAHMEPARYQRQIEIFHDLFGFKKLGMVYEDSTEGRVYAALEDVEKVAAERGFAITRVHVKDKQNDREKHRQEMREAYTRLAGEGVDAVYCSLYIDRDVTELAEQFAPLYNNKIPVFAQMGAAEVKNGALLSVYRADFVAFGKFAAQTAARIFQGEKPRYLPQVFENTPSIVLNLEVAGKIGYHPPFEVFLVTDEIYQTIERTK
ncbi:MAG TPA: ABC transporter substrate binding protein [Patescibacteria group bacterium]|nr:ABC transporter substrate binding protein [Patescibacteria group bacterium]